MMQQAISILMAFWPVWVCPALAGFFWLCHRELTGPRDEL